MLTRTSPVLSDGTKVSDLIFPDTREVQMRVLSDREIYELEMEKIFGKIWVFLGHESEIPNSGDFVVRDMGFRLGDCRPWQGGRGLCKPQRMSPPRHAHQYRRLRQHANPQVHLPRLGVPSQR